MCLLRCKLIGKKENRDRTIDGSAWWTRINGNRQIKTDLIGGKISPVNESSGKRTVTRHFLCWQKPSPAIKNGSKIRFTSFKDQRVRRCMNRRNVHDKEL
jgi:hypothetical protein